MKILLYAPGRAAKWVHGVMKDFLPGKQIEVHRNLEALEARLRQPKVDLAAAVIVAATSEDLDRLVAIADYLEDFRLILLLPDRNRQTIAKGHKLRPRFLSYVDANFSDVVEVLNKMLDNPPVIQAKSLPIQSSF